MRRRWWIIAGAAAFVLVVVPVLALTVLYPRVGAWAVRSKALPRIEARLGRAVEVGAIDVGRGRAVLRDVVVRGDGDGDAPLIHIPEVDVEFAFWPSLLGRAEVGIVRLRGPRIAAVRKAGGANNYGALLAALRRPSPGGEGGGEGGGRRLRAIVVEDGRLELRDEASALTLVAEGAAARLEPGAPVTGSIAGLAALSGLGPRARLERIELKADPKDPLGTATVLIGDGRVDLWRGMALTGVRGSVAAADRPGVLAIDLEGGYAGVDGTLWRARGKVDPRARKGELHLGADEFTFARIAPFLDGLEGKPVVDYEATTLDAVMDLALDGDLATVSGEFEVRGLNLFHPGIAEETMKDLGGRASLAARYDRATRTFTLDEARVSTRGVDYILSGRLERHGERQPGDRFLIGRRLAARLQVPKVGCQQMLQSIPPALVPHLQGFKLKGDFATDVGLEVDWADLQAAKLGGKVGIAGCKVVAAPPEMDPERLTESFEHEIEVEEDVWKTIEIGPESKDFVPLAEVSIHLVNSLMTTEDSSFMKHDGFLVREFRTALVKDLEAGYFKYGASSITMQMVKNVLLSRVKTIGRKVQELFLTWYVEQILEKERILEIYLNAIEYGPGLYGIKPAAAQYFGKLPSELNPTEAAFFSTILPAPKRRYVQFCKDKLSPWTLGKIQRILQLMVERDRLSVPEFEIAMATPLVFQPDKRGDFCTKKWGEPRPGERDEGGDEP